MITLIRTRRAPVVRAFLTLGLLACGLHAVPVLTLIPPGGAVAGAPGDVVGWGFNLSNSPDWLVVTNSAFCIGTGHTAADIGTANCTTAYAATGTYSDYIANHFSSTGITIGDPNPPDPNGGPACTLITTTFCDTPTLTQNFDGISQGVGQFAISPSAVSGTISGELLVTYDLFSVSPNNPAFNPDTDILATDQFFNPAASVTVTAVPEPRTILLITTAFAGFGLLRLRRRRRT